MRPIDADNLTSVLDILADKGGDVRMWEQLKWIVADCPTIEPERKKGRWIPCTEQMPDIDEDGYTDKVLVSFDHYSGVEICEYRITDGVGRWYAGDTDDSPEDIDLQVTAWMPLPERYEGGAE